MAGGWCHHPSGERKWCGWVSCHPEPSNQHIGYPECCGVSAQGCGGVESTSQVQGTASSSTFGTGQPVGSGLEIAVLTGNMAGADGSKTRENPEINTIGDLAVHLLGVVAPVIIVGTLIYVGIRRLG